VLTGRDGFALLRAEARVTRARLAVKVAEQARERVRARVRPHLPPGEDVHVGRYKLRRTMGASSPTIRLADYLKQHPVTAEMEPHMGTRKGSETWTVERT